MQEPAWIKSSYSCANSNCVEVRRHGDGQVEVRNSRFPDLRLPAFTRGEWDAFIAGVSDGEFGQPVRGIADEAIAESHDGGSSEFALQLVRENAPAQPGDGPNARLCTW